jgi:hypothetical protein
MKKHIRKIRVDFLHWSTVILSSLMQLFLAEGGHVEVSMNILK